MSMHDHLPIADEHLDGAADDAEALATRIGRLLAGQHPGVVGCALAQVAAKWLAGHQPAAVQAEILPLHVNAIRELATIENAMIRAAMLGSAGRA